MSGASIQAFIDAEGILSITIRGLDGEPIPEDGALVLAQQLIQAVLEGRAQPDYQAKVHSVGMTRIPTPRDFTIEFPGYQDTPVGKAPAYWRDEQSGILEGAILAYMNRKASTPQLRLVQQYFKHWADCPGWDENPHADDESRARIAQLREAIANCEPTQEALEAWQQQALAEGIDPL